MTPPPPRIRPTLLTKAGYRRSDSGAEHTVAAGAGGVRLIRLAAAPGARKFGGRAVRRSPGSVGELVRSSTESVPGNHDECCDECCCDQQWNHAVLLSPRVYERTGQEGRISRSQGAGGLPDGASELVDERTEVIMPSVSPLDCTKKKRGDVEDRPHSLDVVVHRCLVPCGEGVPGAFE